MNTKPTGFNKEFEHNQQLFDAALDEFIHRGYDNASINTILKNAGMSKGQFYYHFKNKEGLYLACIGVLIDKKTEFMTAVMATAEIPENVFDIFRVRVAFGMQFAQQYPVINRFAESFIKEQGKPIYDTALATYNFDDNTAIDTLIQRGYQQGEFRDDLPLPFIRRVFGYLLTHAIDVTNMDTEDSFEQEMNYLITFMQHGLGRDK